VAEPHVVEHGLLLGVQVRLVLLGRGVRVLLALRLAPSLTLAAHGDDCIGHEPVTEQDATSCAAVAQAVDIVEPDESARERSPAVLRFRLTTFWIPIVPGWLAFTSLSHREEI
jgi:hypothetical protein